VFYVPMTTMSLVRVRKMAANGTARTIREAAGLSLSEMAREVEVDRSTIYRWECGQRRPRGQAATRYLAFLEELSK
jgi:transcriptional regulator with XRE-family HTH domain